MPISILFIIFYILSSCQHQDKSLNKLLDKAIDSLNKTPSYAMDVPLDKYGNPDKFYKISKQIYEKQLAEDSIFGEHDLTITVSSNFDRSYDPQFLKLEFKKNKWVAVFTKYSPQNLKNSTSKINMVQRLNPKTGWNNLTNKLLSLNMLFFPTMDKIKDFDLLVGHSEVNTFEIRTKYAYRFYYYYGEETLKDSQNLIFKKTIDIIKVLEHEFFKK